MPDATIRNRLQLGWSIADTLSKSNVRSDYKPHHVDPIRIARSTHQRHEHGNHSKTLKQLAEAAGMNPATLQTRIRRGLNLDDAIRIPVQHGSIGANASVSLHEQTMTLEQWARHFAISLKTVLSRLRLGWDVEKALSTPPMRPGGKKTKTGGGWSKTSSNGLGTGGVRSLDNEPKQDFFE